MKRFMKLSCSFFVNDETAPKSIWYGSKVLYDFPENVSKDWNGTREFSFDDIYNDREKFGKLMPAYYHKARKKDERYRYITIGRNLYKESDIEKITVKKGIKFIDDDNEKLSSLLNKISVEQFKEWVSDISCTYPIK